MKKNYSFLIIIFFLFSFSFSQTTYYVMKSTDPIAAQSSNISPSDLNNGTSILTPKETLSGAITAAASNGQSGDTIIVGPGEFSDSNLTVSENLTIQGAGRELTKFKLTSGNYGFISIQADVTIKDLTIRDYNYTGAAGGGAVYIGANWGANSTTTNPTVTFENVLFVNNHTVKDGGAIRVAVSHGTSAKITLNINECLFYDNYASEDGGAIFSHEHVDININNSVFADNTAVGYGGAIYFSDTATSSSLDPTITIKNSSFYRNWAKDTDVDNSGGLFMETNGDDDIYCTIYNTVMFYNPIGSSVQWAPWSVGYNDLNGDNYGDDIYFKIKNSWISDYGKEGAYSAYNMYYGYQDINDNGTWTQIGSNSGPGTFHSNYAVNTSFPWEGGGSNKKLWPERLSNVNGEAATQATTKDVNGVDRPQGPSSGSNTPDAGAYEYRNTWTGAASTAWHLPGNWSFNEVPLHTLSTNDAPVIPDLSQIANAPVISTNVTIDHLWIQGDYIDSNGDGNTDSTTGSLTVSKDGSLTVNGKLINDGTLTLQSDKSNFASLVVSEQLYSRNIFDDLDNNQTSDSQIIQEGLHKITYQRHVADVGDDEWDFISSPVYGQDLQALIDANSSLATGGAGNAQVGIGVFSNDAGADTAAAMYTNYNTTGNSGTILPLGKGYVMATDNDDTSTNGATVSFTGALLTRDMEGIPIDDNSSSNTNNGKWNLIGNPYPSFINANDDADSNASNNFLGVNASNLHSSYAYIYGYDGDGTYTYYNHISPGSAVYIAPGQGFFVASDDSSGNTIKFTKAMQTHADNDDFNSGDNMENTEVVIKLFNGDNELESTMLYFEEGLTLGLDVGYDAGSFSQNSPIMTRLVEEDEGHGMAINAMGLDAMENAVIPLVINQSAGQEFRINLFTATIPDPNVYLEDTEEGTFTNLYEGDFVMTPTSDLEGVGRFFIHMTADTMSNEEVSTSMLNAYKEVNANYITIEGLATQSNNINVSLYNILGRRVLDTTLNNNMNTQTISTLGMAAGIYVIELESGADRLTKKLIIQ